MAVPTQSISNTEKDRLPVKKILVTGGAAVNTLSLIAKSTEEVMAARNIAVTARICRASDITPQFVQGYAMIIATTPVNAAAGIPIINGNAFLNGAGYEQVWDVIAAILAKTDLPPAA
jgi:galactitol-specific phosphotransferase system IIB component